MLDWVHGPQPGDPYGCPAPDAAVLGGSSTAGSEPTEDRPADRVPDRGRPSAGSGRRGPGQSRRKLEDLGHEVTEFELPEIGDPEVLYQTFMTRWAAGMSQTADTLGLIAGRPLTPDDVEPLTWALIEQGQDRRRSRLPLGRQPSIS